MFGTYQHSNLRIELAASAMQIRQSLVRPAELRKWLWPQQLKLFNAAGSELVLGQTFESSLGPVTTTHRIEALTPGGVRFLLSGSIDGFHEWQWGEGWVQSRLEGVSLLPLNLGQTASLFRLKQHLQTSDSV